MKIKQINNLQIYKVYKKLYKCRVKQKVFEVRLKCVNIPGNKYKYQILEEFMSLHKAKEYCIGNKDFIVEKLHS